MHGDSDPGGFAEVIPDEGSVRERIGLAGIQHQVRPINIVLSPAGQDGLGFQYVNVIDTRTEGSGRSTNDVSAVGSGLTNRVAVVILGPAVGTRPYRITPDVRLYDVRIITAFTERSGRSCDDLTGLRRCLLNGVTVFHARTPKRFRPECITVLIGLNQINIAVARTERVSTADNDIAAIRERL